MLKVFLIFPVLVVLSACQGPNKIRQILGLERNQPDEFSVVETGPLTLPPDFHQLPEPSKNKKSRAKEKARKVVKLGKKSSQSKAEKELLQNLGTEERNPNIREELEQEQEMFEEEHTSELHKWIPYEAPHADKVLDPELEKERLAKQEADKK